MPARPNTRAMKPKLVKPRGQELPVPIERIANTGRKDSIFAIRRRVVRIAFVKDGVPIVGINSLHIPIAEIHAGSRATHIQLHRAKLETEVHVDKGSLRRTDFRPLALMTQKLKPTHLPRNF